MMWQSLDNAPTYERVLVDTGQHILIAYKKPSGTWIQRLGPHIAFVQPIRWMDMGDLVG